MRRPSRFTLLNLVFAMLLTLAACGGSSPQQPVAIPSVPDNGGGAAASGEPVEGVEPADPSDAPDTVQELEVPEYELDTGDRISINIFRHPDLSGEFEIDGSGRIAFPLIGEVQAEGLSSRQLEQRITERLQDGYLVDPQVGVEILTYRPFFILGEVNNPGRYEYSSGMTVLNAVAMAGGFTYRARQSDFLLQRGGSSADPVRVPGTQEVFPGDIITVDERFF